MTAVAIERTNNNQGRAVTATSGAPRRRFGLDSAWSGFSGVAGLVLVLELLPRSGLVDSRFLPPFSEIAVTLVGQLGTTEFWGALSQTLLGLFLGLSIAAVTATVAGFIIGSSEVLRSATHSTIEFLRPIPSVALIPLVILMFGTDMRSTLVLVVYASFWPILLQILYGLRELDPVAIDTARSYHFSRWTRFRTVLFPTTLPYIVTGLRLAAMIALTLELTGELIIGTPGIGFSIAVAQVSGSVSTMYALIIVTGIIGVLINLLARTAERRALHWHPSIRREGVA